MAVAEVKEPNIVKLHVNIRRRSYYADGRRFRDSSLEPPPIEHLDLNLDIVHELVEPMIYSVLYDPQSLGMEYLIIGRDIVMRACTIKPYGLMPDDFQDFFTRLGDAHRIHGMKIIINGSMTGAIVSPRLDPPPPPQPKLSDRGELIVSHHKAVAKQILQLGVHCGMNQDYKAGVFQALRMLCEGLGIENPQDVGTQEWYTNENWRRR